MNEKQSMKGSRRLLPELLAPAGSLEKLKIAVHYGADAVYLGDSNYSLRSRSGTFNELNLQQAVEYAHRYAVSVYATVNIFAHNRDFSQLPAYLRLLRDCGVDALIVADPGVLATVEATVPGMPVHLSTQANVTNSAAAQFWHRLGIARLNLARELSLVEVAEIRQQCSAELEIFVHGALCISYSGRCLLSHYLTGRDANRGDCAQPCRYRYAVQEEKRAGQWLPVEEDSRGAYIFNAKDLCLLARLPELVSLGADALKIEGRMRSLFYVGSVVRVYRAALDYLKSLDKSEWLYPERIVLPQELLVEVARIGTRELSENFADGPPGAADMLYDSSRAEQQYEPVAVVRDTEPMTQIELRNPLVKGETIEYMHRSMRNTTLVVEDMFDQQWRRIERANPGALVYLASAGMLAGIEVHGLFRRRKALR